MSLFSNISQTLATQVISLALSLATSVITARALAPAGKGLVDTLVADVGVAIALVSLGVPKALTFFVGRRTLPLGPVVGTALSLTAASVAAGAAVFAALLAFSRTDAGGRAGYLAALAAAPLLLTENAIGWAEGCLRGLQRFARVNAAALVRNGAAVAFAGALAAAGALDPPAALLALVAAHGGSLAFVARDLAGRVPIAPAWSWPVARALLGYGVAFQVYSVVQNLHYRLDLLLVSRYLHDGQVGLYSLAAKLAQFAWHLPLAVIFVLQPATAGEDDERQAIERTARVARGAVLLLVPAVAAMALVGDLAIRLLYGDAYAASAGPFRLLLPGMLSSGLFMILGAHLVGRDRLVTLAALAGVGLAANVALNLALIPRHGIAGAALASSVSYTLECALVVVALARLYHVPARALWLPGRADLARLVERVSARLRRR